MFSIVALLICATNLLNAQEISESKFGKGLLNIVGQESSWTMKVGLRFQTLTEASWSIENRGLVKPNSDFLIRRSRLKFEGFAYSPKLEYKFELGLSNENLSGGSVYTSHAHRYIYDAVVQWSFYKNFVLWMGQAKLPGNRERIISSGNMQFVDKSLLNSRFIIDRDMGIQLHQHFNLSDSFIVKEIIAVSQGEGRNISTGNLGGHQYATRLELLPFGEFTDEGDYSGSDLKRENVPKLALAATYDYNNNAVKSRSNQGTYMLIDDGDALFETNISTLFIDAMFKYNDFLLMAEYANRKAKDPYEKNSDGTSC